MVEFRAIPDGVYGEAGDVIRHVRDGGTPPEVEVMPGFGAMVAASAIALEKGAPRAIFTSHDTEADRYLKQGNNEWRMFHKAVARVVDLHRTGEQQFDEPNDVMNHIVGDVMYQARMRHVDLALTNSHEAFLEPLSAKDRDLVEYARDDDDVRRDIRSEASGSYELLPRYSQQDIAADLFSGANLSPELKREIDAAYPAITQANDDLGYQTRYVNERLGNFSDFQSPLFEEIDPSRVARVDHLSHGETRMPSNVEMGVIAHERVFPTKGDGMADYDVRVARARALGDMETKREVVTRYHSPAEVAIAIEADRLAIQEARKSHMLDPRDVTLKDEIVRQATEHHTLPAEDQASLFRDIRTGDAVPGVSAMRLSLAALEIEAEARSMQTVLARPDRGVDRSIRYEGIDLSTDPERYPTDALRLPGDEVRIDHTRNIYGDSQNRLDTKGLEAHLGEDALTISKTIVTGRERDDGMGGTEVVMRTEHEFVGKEGRYPAVAFMDHRGEHFTYGMLAVENDRLWLVPMEDNGNPQFNSEISGAPREVMGFVQGKTEREREDSLALLRHEVEQAPQSGEFYYRPEMFGDMSGRIDILASPFMAGAWEREVEIGSAAIANRIDGQWAESLEQTSAEWRERNGRPSAYQRDIEAESGYRKVEFDEAGVQSQRGDFRKEMAYMFEDLESTPGLIQTAARIAARGRPLDPEVEAQSMIREMRRPMGMDVDVGRQLSR